MAAHHSWKDTDGKKFRGLEIMRWKKKLNVELNILE